MGPVDRLPVPLIRWIARQQFRPYVGPLIRRSTRGLRSRPRVVAHGQARGLRIDPSGAYAGYALGTSEPEIQDLLAAQIEPGSVVWDVGANVGFYTLIAARLVGSGTVVAFEPLPANRAALRRNLELNGIRNVTIVDVAISDEVGTATFNEYESSASARLADRGNTASKRTPIRCIEVSVSTLDAQLQALPAPALVKMDIEGAEGAALRAATALLSDVKPILICELHGTNGAVMDALDACGYRATTVGAPDVMPRDAVLHSHILGTPA